MISAIIARPEAWAGAFVIILGCLGAGIAWLWGQHVLRAKGRSDTIADLQKRVTKCETDRALLRREVSELRGSVKTLTDLLAREANIG